MTSNAVNVDETAEVSEIVQASSSAQTNDEEDQEVDDAIIDKIIVDKVFTLLFSNLNLEEIWIKVMERLKKDNLRVQSIESRIVYLSDWTKIKWCLRREEISLYQSYTDIYMSSHISGKIKFYRPIIGTILEEIDIRSRKSLAVLRTENDEEYMDLTISMKKMDLIVTLRSHKNELLPLEVENTEIFSIKLNAG
ncbi:hypothetical protein RhiirC2_778454 [Rhizophagus irregularis]|uniref:Uncharacterized protein n=1 Tax=Rhizophagus irregularis TaxID=588596 RepID=A0A2N1NBY2_9GLOM|nr:hypothetical protein RhiirC2_778454 [Rhizophagus irregularis]